MVHTVSPRGLIELIASLSPSPGPAVKHALSIRSAVSLGDYHAFFTLYHQAPNMSGYLIDHFLQRERLMTFLKLVKAYRPSLSIEFFASHLGFIPPMSPISKKHLRDAFSWIREVGVEVSKGEIDCKAAVGTVVECLAQLNQRGVDIK